MTNSFALKNRFFFWPRNIMVHSLLRGGEVKLRPLEPPSHTPMDSDDKGGIQWAFICKFQIALNVVNIKGTFWVILRCLWKFLFHCIGWIGSIAWATNFLVSPLAVFVESRIGYCATTVLGFVITSAAYLISSFMGSYGEVLLVLGFVCGSAAGLCIHSSFCVLYKYFSPEYQTKASSVMSTGSSVGKVMLKKHNLFNLILTGIFYQWFTLGYVYLKGKCSSPNQS